MSLLPVEPAWRLADRAEEQRWLVTGLWSEQAVGIIGGEPSSRRKLLRKCSLGGLAEVLAGPDFASHGSTALHREGQAGPPGREAGGWRICAAHTSTSTRAAWPEPSQNAPAPMAPLLASSDTLAF